MSTQPTSLPLWERFETIAGKAEREADEQFDHRPPDIDRSNYCKGQAQAWREAAKMARPVIEELQRERDEAREWVRRLTARDRVLTCVYCGHAYPPGTPAHGSEVLTAHIAVCDKHPMHSVLVERDALAAKVEAFQLASGLCVPAEEKGGDPGGVEPHHVERYIGKVEAERDEAIKRAEEVARFADSLIDMVDDGDASRLDTDEARRSLEKLMGWEEGRLVSPKEATP